MLFANLLEILDPQPHRAALNMAIDEVLLRGAALPLLRVYRWERPATSFGYFEKWSAFPQPPPGGEIVRRWTGGGAVRHGGDVTYTLIVPSSHEFARVPAAESYRRIHALLATVLATPGTNTALAPFAAPRVAGGCFANPAAADILAGGRKIAGAAQRRTRWGLLHQGSIQSAALGKDFARRLAGLFSEHHTQRPLAADELSAAEKLAAEKYATDAWQQRFA